MERYLLLRNNCEYGPYDREELKAYGLLPTDLIWVEGSSTAWSHPDDIQALKPFAKDGVRQPLPAATSPSPVSGSPSLQDYRMALAAEPHFKPAGEGKAFAVFTERVSDYDHSKTATKKKLTLNPNVLALPVLLIGVMFGAFLLKKMVDTFGDEAAPSAEAIEIREESLPVSTSVHTAQVSQSPAPLVPASVLPADIVTEKPPAPIPPKKPLTAVPKPSAAVKKEAVKETPKMEPSPEENIAGLAPEESPDTKAKVTQPPALQVSANDYKVGLFGGISNLEINIANPSSQKAGKTVVEIEYLKPNGNVVKTQTVGIDAIAAGGSASIPVPSSNRGVKIRYRIVSVETQN